MYVCVFKLYYCAGRLPGILMCMCVCACVFKLYYRVGLYLESLRNLPASSFFPFLSFLPLSVSLVVVQQAYQGLIDAM